jgi:hypothetical protein
MVIKGKKGQLIIVKIMLAIVVLIAAIFIYPATNQQIDTSQNTSSNLNCSASNNSNAIKGTCIILDMGLFYFIACCLSVGLAFITGRKTITGVLTAIFTTIICIVLITPLKEFITLMRGAGYLSCGTAGISVGQNLLCIFVDLWLFYFIAVAISASITYITLREFTPENE